MRFLFLGNPSTDRRVKNFIGLFFELGYEIELLFASPGEKEIVMHIEGVQIKKLPLQYSRGAKMFLQYDQLVKKELQNSKPCDILFSCELYSLRVAAFAKKNGQAKQLFYDARELYTELPSVASKPFKKWFWKWQERKGLEQTDLVIVTAPDDADAIKQVHGFLPPSILVRNLPKMEELKPNTYLREHFSISPEKKIFVYIGGVQQDRGLEKIIDIMPRLQQDAVFVIIGEGARKQYLRRQCKRLGLEDNIFFHPLIESEQVIEVLASADVGISLIEQHSQSYELALPSKIFEYMLAGLPVISSPLKQVKDLFNNAEGILFADPENSEQIVNTCHETIEMSRDHELQKRRHAYAVENFTFETDAEVFKKFLTKHLTSVQ